MEPAKKPRIFFLSNGHGEDLIAARIIEELRQLEPGWPITALPLVGLGSVYGQKNIAAIGPRKNMPSGGFVVGLPAILRDIRAGLIALIFRQLMTCRQMRSQTDLAVAVGDVYPLFLGARFVRKPLVFLPTAISHHVGAHNKREISLMKHFTLAVFPRDARTAQELAREGVKAEFLGNVMMDCLAACPENAQYFAADHRVAILPGSREEAYNKFSVILPAVELLAEKAGRAGRTIKFSLAKSGQLKDAKISAAAGKAGWEFSAEQHGPFQAFLKKGRLEIGLAEGALGDILQNCDAVLGLAGTANEQAVGLGKMVVAFYGRGPQITKRFLENQARLLAGAVLVVPPEPAAVAERIWSVLTDPGKYQGLVKSGQARMTGTGSARRIALAIQKAAAGLDL